MQSERGARQGQFVKTCQWKHRGRQRRGAAVLGVVFAQLLARGPRDWRGLGCGMMGWGVLLLGELVGDEYRRRCVCGCVCVLIMSMRGHCARLCVRVCECACVCAVCVCVCVELYVGGVCGRCVGVVCVV